MSTPVYVARRRPVSPARMPEAVPRTAIQEGASATSCAANDATAAREKTIRVQAPTDIGLWILNTRSMWRNRVGRPRSEIKSGGAMRAPAAAIQRACSAMVVNDETDGKDPASLRRPAIAAMTAAAPDAPPTKKYAGTSHVQTGGLSRGTE